MNIRLQSTIFQFLKLVLALEFSARAHAEEFLIARALICGTGFPVENFLFLPPQLLIQSFKHLLMTIQESSRFKVCSSKIEETSNFDPRAHAHCYGHFGKLKCAR